MFLFQPSNVKKQYLEPGNLLSIVSLTMSTPISLMGVRGVKGSKNMRRTLPKVLENPRTFSPSGEK
jgi:hypothetical protein